MRKIALLLICWIVSCFPATVAAAFLSGESRVSLITCGPGSELYSIFGHTAIRISDPVLGIDRVYNYGTFDFNDPDFYPKFLRGSLLYYLAAGTWEDFEFAYRYEERDVFEQEILLHPEEREQVMIFLEENLLPENRKYLYDFVRDNCTTRVRDVLAKACSDSLDFGKPLGITWRKGLQNELSDHPWISLGINLLLGFNTDQQLNVQQEMFLPDLLMQRIGQTFREGGNPYVSTTRQLISGAVQPKPFFRHMPLLYSLILLAFSVYLIFREAKTSRYNPWFDRFCFGIAGLVGIVIAFMWFGSSHFATQNNINILWAFPTHLIFAFFIRKTPTPIQIHYARFTLFIGIAFIFSAGLSIQRIPAEVFPLVIMLLLRAGNMLHRNR